MYYCCEKALDVRSKNKIYICIFELVLLLKTVVDMVVRLMRVIVVL